MTAAASYRPANGNVLSIARSLVKDTPILILDEPTAALDADTEHRVLERLAEWGQESFGIPDHASHLDDSESADHILYIDKGRLVESGSHEN